MNEILSNTIESGVADKVKMALESNEEIIAEALAETVSAGGSSEVVKAEDKILRKLLKSNVISQDEISEARKTVAERMASYMENKRAEAEEKYSPEANK